MPCQWSSLRGGRKKKPKKKTFVGYSAARFQCEIVSQLSAGGGVAEAAEAVVVTVMGRHDEMLHSCATSTPVTSELWSCCCLPVACWPSWVLLLPGGSCFHMASLQCTACWVGSASYAVKVVWLHHWYVVGSMIIGLICQWQKHRVFNCRGSQSCWVWVCLLLLNRKLSTVVSPVIHSYSMICVPLHPQGVFTTSEVMMLSAVFMNIIFLSI